jgi:hypothetical protein
MPHYLSNIDRDDKYQHIVYVAALRSGQNVKYIDAPMPPDGYADGTYYQRNYVAGNFNNLGCIVGFEDYKDYSNFWAEYRKLRL